MSVRRVAEQLAAALGPGAVVRHHDNHAGAGKLSFAVRVGDRRLWAKVAADDDEQTSLATWSRVHALLTERHGAPPVLDVLDVGGRTALVFAFIDAPVASRTGLHRRYDEARALLEGLHEDAELAQLLGGPTTAGAAHRATWLSRFEADLDLIEGYVAKDLHAYLCDEVDALGALVDALDDPVHAAVHGDPWHENVLLAPHRLWLLDWEDLAVGDPVVDDAILRYDALGSDPHHWPDTLRDLAARRALMLDQVIDIAADWVETTDLTVRRNKEAAYLAGLEAYRDVFG